MSYDILFIRKAEGQSWQEALEANEARTISKQTRNAPAPEATREEWRRISTILLDTLPGLERFEAPHTLELTDNETGVQVSFYEEEAAISIPYWHSGEAAKQVMRSVRQLAHIIERETGLLAYDPQQGRRFLDMEAAADDAEELLGSTRAKIQDQGALDYPQKAKRRWWEFWKRR